MKEVVEVFHLEGETNTENIYYLLMMECSWFDEVLAIYHIDCILYYMCPDYDC